MIDVAVKVPGPAFFVLCCGDVDYECGTQEDAKRHARSLVRHLGFEPAEVKVKAFRTWDEAYAWQSKARGY